MEVVLVNLGGAITSHWKIPLGGEMLEHDLLKNMGGTWRYIQWNTLHLLVTH